MRLAAFEVTSDGHMQGFHMTFRNGNTVSVQFGRGNYADGGITTAEIAAWDRNENWIRLPGWNDDVRGHCTPDEVAEFIQTIREM